MNEQPKITLLEYLQAQGMNNKNIKQALEYGKVFYGDMPTADLKRLVHPEWVRIRMQAPRIRVGRDLSVVYRDNDIAVVYKPSGMLSVGAKGRKGELNVVSSVAKLFKEAHPVHRLDEGTSGLMMVALRSPVQRILRDMFADHAIDRHYLAIVRHVFPAQEKRIESVLIRNRGDGLRGSFDTESDNEPDDTGKKAVTYLKRVEKLQRDASIVQARLETGRTHQVRIHLAEQGFPVLGDALYGNVGIARASRRLALHATRLQFKHPVSGQQHQFHAPLADDLESLKRFLNH